MKRVAKCKYSLNSNNFKGKQTKHSNQKAGIAKLNNKARSNPTFSMREILYMQRNKQLKVKDGKKTYHSNSNK